MKKLLSAMAVGIAVTLVVIPLTYGQGKAAPPAQAQAEKTFQGQLTKVDAKMISVKGAGDMEMTFALTDATQVTGSEKDVQGLAGKTGSELKVTYRDVDGKHTATKIEIAERR